jgi:hypothetical protein
MNHITKHWQTSNRITMKIPTCLITTILCGLTFLLPGLLTSCVTSFDLVEVTRGAAERRRGPQPESAWNAVGLWQRVSENPATYIPQGYPASAPRSNRDGTWVMDVRDGKRLFVPNVTVEGYPPGVLLGEAKKITNWSPRQIHNTQPGFIAIP